MEIPALVRERLGDEEIRAGVSIGDEDAVCLTPTRTLVYRGEGLLSDESVEVLSHDVERIDVSEGRRKTKFVLTYVDGEKSFTVPGNRAEKVLERLMEGVLRVADVAEPDESVLGVYRFSELALVLTEGRLVKHVGSSVWDEDFEEFAFADVTGLAFEEGSVATQIVLSIDGRPQRIKAPNDEAPKLRQTLADALCDYHGADSLATLNDMLGPDEDESAADDGRPSGDSGGLTLDDGIDPLVGGDADDGGSGSGLVESPRSAGSGDSTESAGTSAPSGSAGASGPSGSAGTNAASGSAGASTSSGGADSAGSSGPTEPASPASGAEGEPGSTARSGSSGSNAGGGRADAGQADAGQTDAGQSDARQSDANHVADPSGAGGAAGGSVDPLDETDVTTDVEPGVEPGVSRADVEAIDDRLETLTTAVKRQNELLRKQQRTIKQLVEELRQGR